MLLGEVGQGAVHYVFPTEDHQVQAQGRDCLYLELLLAWVVAFHSQANLNHQEPASVLPLSAQHSF